MHMSHAHAHVCDMIVWLLGLLECRITATHGHLRAVSTKDWASRWAKSWAGPEGGRMGQQNKLGRRKHGGGGAVSARGARWGLGADF